MKTKLSGKARRKIEKYANSNAAEILETALDGYNQSGRGYVLVNIRSPGQQGGVTYVSQREYEGMIAAGLVNRDAALDRMIATYKPGNQAIARIYHGLQYAVFELSGTPLNASTPFAAKATLN